MHEEQHYLVQILCFLLAAVVAVAWLGIPRALGTRIPADFLATRGELVDFREGVVANVAVLKSEDSIQLEIDGWWHELEFRTASGWLDWGNAPILAYGRVPRFGRRCGLCVCRVER